MKKIFPLILLILLSTFDAIAGKNLQIVRNPFQQNQVQPYQFLYSGQQNVQLDKFLGQIFKFDKIQGSRITDVEIRYPVELFMDQNGTDCSSIKQTLQTKGVTEINNKAGIISEYTYQFLHGSCAQGNPGYPVGHYLLMKTVQSHMYEVDFKGTCTHEGGIEEGVEVPAMLYFTVHIPNDNQEPVQFNISCKVTDKYAVVTSDRLDANQIRISSKNCVGIDGYFEKLNVVDAFGFKSNKNLHQVLPGFKEYLGQLRSRYAASKNPR